MNESLFINHPFLNNVIIWDKAKSKYKHLFELLKQIRATKYDIVVNVQRFAATGFLTAFSKAKTTIGFHKNPFSFLFSTKVKHIVSNAQNPLHEIERNQMLIHSIASGEAMKPKLYPSNTDEQSISTYITEDFVCIAPASVWFTKQFPIYKWIELVNAITSTKVYLLGAKNDISMCNDIIAKSNHQNIESLAGRLSFLQSAALMKRATMNYVNDSAPMHFASSVDAPTTAVYCSTLPAFGFGPLSSKRFIVESFIALTCRPCGLHGQKSCPLGHYDCANNIKVEQLTQTLIN
jgi:heptosyltransferase-2